MTVMPSLAPPLPNPVFEGSEKRLELDFFPSASSAPSAPAGLRALRRDQLDELMSLARCTIVSQRSNGHLDAYVLSESSLFVYPTKWVLKTCGTTRLLHSVPRLLELAAELGLLPRRCKFTRASFLFPDQQLYPHCSPANEVHFLQRHFGHLQPGGGQATVVGELSDGLQWHVYIAEAAPLVGVVPEARPAATCNLEICMTDLGRDAAQQFYRDGGFVSAAETTWGTGIAALMPRALVDDYVFEPCGYSMNGIDHGALMTIHVTPEAGQSYASLEMSGRRGEVAMDPCQALASALRIFRPARASLALSIDGPSDAAGADDAGGWRLLHNLPPGYACCAAQLRYMPGGGRLAYYTFTEAPVAADGGAAGAAAPILLLASKPEPEEVDEVEVPGDEVETEAKMLHVDSSLSMESAGGVVVSLLSVAAIAKGRVGGAGAGFRAKAAGSSGSSVGSASDCAGLMVGWESEGEVGGSSSPGGGVSEGEC